MSRSLCSFLFLLFPLLLFSEDYYVKNNSVENKTIEVSIFNNSRFDIEIVKEDFLSEPIFKIKPLETQKLICNVSNEKIYLFYRYLIPIGDDFISLDNFDWRFPIISNKNQSLKIPEIKENPEREIYCIIKNKSNTPIYLCHSAITYKSIKNSEIISVGSCEVFSSKNCHLFLSGVLLSISNQVSSFPLPNKDLQSGFVYTYIFDGKQIVKEDERPLLKTGEPLWNRNGADGVSVSKLISAPAGDIFYAVGKVRKKDANGNPYDAGFIQCTEHNGRERWTRFFEETGCDSTVYDGIALDNGDLLAVGHASGDVQHGLALLYSSDGVLLNTQKIATSSAFESVIPLSAGAFLVTGFDSEDKLIFGKVHIEKSVIRYEPFSAPLPLAGTEFVTNAFPLYDSRIKTLFVCCNLLDTETELPLPSALFTLAEDGTSNRIPLKYVIKSVAAVRKDANGMLYIGGETGAAEHSTAMIVTVDAAQNKQAAFYTGGAPYAYIADMQLNEKSGELIIAGTEKAADSTGNNGTPFFKSLALSSGKELWTAGYSDKTYELLSSFIPCTDYGFIAHFTSVNEGGEYSPPVCTARLSATGKMGK